MIKPYLFILLIVGALQITGQLGHVISYGQQAVLATGVLNAGDEAGSEETFDFSFEAISPDGKPLDKEALKNKVIFLNLWATWCGPCRAEMPTIQQLHDELGNNDVAFVILSLDQGATARKKVQDYVTKNKFTFPVYILRSAPTQQLAVPSIPTTFVVSKSGKIARTEVGMRNYNTERFKKFLTQLANE